VSKKHAFIIMTKNKWWIRFRNRHFQGKQVHSYVQRGPGPPKKAVLIFFYVTKPVGKIAGYAEFMARETGDSGELWIEYGHESVLDSKSEYDELVGDKRKVSFIRFKNLTVANHPIELNEILVLMGARRLSRKGFYVGKETADELIALMR
jgi:predicted transcriptional regulator